MWLELQKNVFLDPTLTTFLSGCSTSNGGFSTMTQINRRQLEFFLMMFDILKWKTLGDIYIIYYIQIDSIVS